MKYKDKADLDRRESITASIHFKSDALLRFYCYRTTSGPVTVPKPTVLYDTNEIIELSDFDTNGEYVIDNGEFRIFLELRPIP
ncbi:MAG: hypothetical protein ACPGLV_11205 [Bacteroidia bacterium]